MDGAHSVRTWSAPGIPRQAAGLALGALLCGCMQMPLGPSVAVMPSPYKPFDVFIQDDQLCRDWAARSIGMPGRDRAADQMLASTLAGAAIGTVAGAMAGGDRGVGTGAAIGTVLGASVGANQSGIIAWNAQRRYDAAYQQCMYAKGNVVRGYYGPMVPSAPPERR